MESGRAFLHDVFIAQGGEAHPLAVAIRAAIIFVVAIAYVRMAKKRFMAQATAVDLVMVIMFGSILSRGVNGGATLLSTLVAGLVLVALQRLFAHFTAQSHRFGRLVKGSIETLVRDGVVDRAEMRHHDISEADLLSEMRVNGRTDDFQKVALATLERSGHISIVLRESPPT